MRYGATSGVGIRGTATAFRNGGDGEDGAYDLLARKGFGKPWKHLIENDIVALSLIMLVVWAIGGVFYLSRRNRSKRSQQR